MADYLAPLNDMRFVLRELAGFDEVTQLPGFEEISIDMADAVLDESARFSSGVLSPLNVSGDRAKISWQNTNGGSVTMPPGFKEADRKSVV